MLDGAGKYLFWAFIFSILVLFSCSKEFSITGIDPHSGVLGGGEVIKIKGSGFKPGMGVTVYFGDSKAPNVIVDDTATMSVTTPPGRKEGPIDIRVRTDDGREYLLKRNFRYVESGSIQLFDAFGREKGRRSRKAE